MAYRTRYYNPSWGRFVGADLLEAGSTANRGVASGVANPATDGGDMINDESGGFRRVHRSARAEAFYEQCVWNKEHVDAIYPVLRGKVHADGGWHDIAREEGHVGRYRVFERRYFQAVFAPRLNPVFEALSAIEPVETRDDAEWAVWRAGPEEGYVLSSTFATTAGQFEHQPVVDAWLWRHGLGLEPGEDLVEGVAYFDAIEAGCLGEAMERLHWLEAAFADLYQRLDEASRRFWDELESEGDAIVRALGETEESDALVPLPNRYPRQGWKRRVPAAGREGDQLC